MRIEEINNIFQLIYVIFFLLNVITLKNQTKRILSDAIFECVSTRVTYVFVLKH